jgi:two-component system response regulator AtoC
MKSIVVLGEPHVLAEMLEGAPEQTAVLVAPPKAVAVEGGPPALDTLRDIARRAARNAQRDAIESVLREVHWNRAEAARRLRISYKALLYKIDQCGLARKLPRRNGSEG